MVQIRQQKYQEKQLHQINKTASIYTILAQLLFHLNVVIISISFLKATYSFSPILHNYRNNIQCHYHFLPIKSSLFAKNNNNKNNLGRTALVKATTTKSNKDAFFPIQYYNKKLSNTTIEKWIISKEISIEQIYMNITKNQENKNSKRSTAKKEAIQQNTTSILGKREIPNVNESTHLNVVYIDEHIVVTNKPSGILSVPGPRRHPSLLSLVYTLFAYPNYNPDQMVCHRLDMDTSGIILYARTIPALQKLQIDFRSRLVKKVYEALLCGFLNVEDGEIDLPLGSNSDCLPFVCVVPKEEGNTSAGDGSSKKSNSKESLTYFQVIGREYYYGYPVTRVRLIPHTGRTHQLRVHCAAIGHPIVADPIYGLQGPACNVTPFQENHNHTNNLQPLLHESIIKTYNISLCLHAKELYIRHPVTNTHLIFECKPLF